MNLINVGYKDQQQILSRKLELENWILKLAVSYGVWDSPDWSPSD